MDEKTARKILGEAVNDHNNDLGSFERVYLDWDVENETACLDGHFTVDQLEAIAWWIRYKKATQ